MARSCSRPLKDCGGRILLSRSRPLTDCSGRIVYYVFTVTWSILLLVTWSFGCRETFSV